MSESGWKRYRSIWRPRVQQDVDDEMDFHLRMRVEEFVAAGVQRDDAERVARERYGNVPEVRSTLVGIDRRQRRRLDWGERLHDLRHDTLVSIRSLAREPRFALGVIITLGLGIAANATMFGVVDRLLLRGPAGVVDAAHVQRLYESWAGPEHEIETTEWLGYIAYTTLRDHSRAFTAAAAYNSPYPQSLGSGANVRPVPTAHATWDLFPLLGVKPRLGRFYSRAEDTPGQTAHVAVISEGLWRSDFAGRTSILGATIDVDGDPYTVIGVAPAGFNGPDRARTDIWLPMTLQHPCTNWTTTLTCQWLQVVVRVAPGISRSQADDDATRALRPAYAGGDENLRSLRGTVRPLWYGTDGKPSGVARVAQWLMGVALRVLLVTCANVTNLLLARARRRRREIAVRLALGAGAGRLFRLMLTEAAIVSLASAVLAIALSLLGGKLMRATLLSAVTLSGRVVDPRVFVFTFGLALVVALAVGAVAAGAAVGLDVTAGLRETASAGGGQRHRVRATLTGLQAALSVVLLIGAGLFMRSLYDSEHVQLGFDAAAVLQAELRFPNSVHLAGATATGQVENHARTLAVARAAADLARQPWVAHASVAVGSPFGNSFGVPLRVPGVDSIPQLSGGGPYISAVTSDYFATVGTRLVRGRLFTPQERDGTAPVTIINQTMAALLWPGQDALTKCLIIGDDPNPPCATVIGVVADVHRNSISEPPTMQYYIPLGQERHFSGPVILVRPRGDAPQQTERTRKTLSALSGVADVRVKWMESLVDPEFAPYRLGAIMFGIFGALALIIAAVGLYSVIAYLVADRTREIGVRLALGAGAPRIVRQVVGRGATTVVLGIIGGLVASALAAPYLEPLLFHVHARNAAIFAAAGIVVLLIALLATWAPARRASRVDPLVALRAD